MNQKTNAHDEHVGMSAIEYACIHLKVPASGTDWLDDLIQRASTTVPQKQVPKQPPSGLTERDYSDEVIQQGLKRLNTNSTPLNTFQRGFCQDVGSQNYPLTDRQYAVALKILVENGYDLDDATKPPDPGEDIPF